MSAPRIFIRVSAEYQDWEWTCTRCKPSMAGGSYGYEWELSAAADAGRAHLAAHHTAQMPPLAHGDPDCLNVPQNAIQRAYDTTRSTA